MIDHTTYPEDRKNSDVEQLRNELQIAVAGVQTTIEHTEEDSTRIRMKSVLKSLLRITRHLDAHFKAND